MCKHTSVAILAVAILCFAANVQAELIFSDNFNTATTPDSGNDYCLNTDLADRQAGSSLLLTIPAGVQWVRHTGNWTQVANTQQVNSAALGAANAMVTYLSSDRGTFGGTALNYQAAVIQHNFASDLYGKAFTVRWDTDPLSSGTPTTITRRDAGTYVFVGSNYPNGGENPGSPTQIGFGDKSNDVCIYVGDNGTAYVQQGTQALWTANTVFDTTAGTTGSSIVRAYTFELRLSTFAPSTPAVASLWWGMQGTTSESLVQVAIGSASMPGTSDGKSLAFTWDANTVNYIGVGGAAHVTDSRSMIDNVSVSAIPEPSTLAMLAAGMIGLLAYAWRKRK